MMFYKIDFRCNDEEELQSKLNCLHNYKDNIGTKILHRNRINLFCFLMEKLIEQNVIESFDSAIDIGCGPGVYSKIMSDFGFRYVLGIDIDNKIIEKANDFFAFNGDEKVLEYEVLNAENIGTNKKCNFVLCTEVIEHTDNPIKLIENIGDILAPKGIAIISLPNKISLPYLFAFLFYRILTLIKICGTTDKIRNKRINKSLEQHLNYPFYKSIRLFRDNNLKIVETSGTNLILVGIILRFLYKTPIFTIINKINFHLSRLWPLKYFTQFFFIVLKNEGTLPNKT